MPWVTGVELGPESCVLARVRTSGRTVRLSAVAGVDERDSNSARTLIEDLADARRRGRFPGRARVVVWGLPESVANGDALATGLAAPLREAGFKIDAVMSPAQALVVWASRRPRGVPGGIVWLALNCRRAAIAIVESGRLLYSREFDWHYPSPTTTKQKLLHRYLLVAHLAPQVRHGIDVVHAQYGVSVDSIVTCGNLPNLRSLTMPLVEELDIEVETLDLPEGFGLDRGVNRELVAERASALYLAVAAGVGEPRAQAAATVRRLVASAAIVAMVLVGGWLTLRSVSHRTADSASVPASSLPAAQPQMSPTMPAPAPVERRTQPPVPSTPAATTGRQERQPQNPATAISARHRQQRQENGQPLADPLPLVNSILVSPERRLAVVAGEIVREGDAIGRRVLVRIERDSLVLREPSGLEVRAYIRRRVPTR